MVAARNMPSRQHLGTCACSHGTGRTGSARATFRTARGAKFVENGVVRNGLDSDAGFISLSLLLHCHVNPNTRVELPLCHITEHMYCI
jgi:hypothetical protein